MKVLICSIYDGAIGAFQMPFYARSKGEASRIFFDAVQEKNSPFNKHPGDFTLFILGAFDDKLGDIEQFDVHEKLLTAFQCLNEVDHNSALAAN